MTSTVSPLSQLLIGAAEDSGSLAYHQVIDHAEARLKHLVRQMFSQFSRLRRWEESDDILQEAAVRLHASLREVKPLDSRQFYGLATLQIRRTLLDLARRYYGQEGLGRRHQSDPNFQPQASTRESRADLSPAPQSLAEWTEFHESVGCLPADEREVFEAIYYSGATYREASELFGVTRRTVIRRMNRARIKLAQLLYLDVSSME